MHSANTLLSPLLRFSNAMEMDRHRGEVRRGQLQKTTSQPFLCLLFFVFRKMPPWEGEGGVTEKLFGVLFVQAHGRALVHAHVGIAQQAPCLTLDAFRIQGVQLLWCHF